ncbi:MAG: hypothetical protein J1F11_05560 [Oscillospiraceae bacterium]|nr:hypothetical protein [Oscillospiraceae bacterium]
MKDKVFGELIYDGGWAKEEMLSLWGKTDNIKIIVSAYEDEKPNEEQQDAYKRLKSDLNEISKLSLKKLKKYMTDIEDDITVYCNISSIPEDVFELVTIDNILFMESGSFAIICDAKWDSHGVAVLCKEFEVEAGPQDIVWLEG